MPRICFIIDFYVHFLISACADLARKHPEIKNFQDLVSSFTDARIGGKLGFIQADSA